MSPVEVLRELATRGVRLELRGDRLHVAAPAGALSAADRQILGARKAELLGTLRHQNQETDLDRTGVPSSPSPCQACGAPFSWAENWPTTGEGRWLCVTCAAWPPASLAGTWGRLTKDERDRLRRDAHAGDSLARVILTKVERGV